MSTPTIAINDSAELKERIDAFPGGPAQHRARSPQGDCRTGRGHRTGDDLFVCGRPLLDHRSAGNGQDAAGAHAGADARPGVQAHPVHARPDAVRHHRHRHHRRRPHHRTPHLDLRARARFSRTSCWPTKSTARLPRRNPRCSKPCRSCPAPCAGINTRSKRRFLCWPPRTPSSWKAPIRCPKRSSIASCSIPCSIISPPTTK